MIGLFPSKEYIPIACIKEKQVICDITTQSKYRTDFFSMCKIAKSLFSLDGYKYPDNIRSWDGKKLSCYKLILLHYNILLFHNTLALAGANNVLDYFVIPCVRTEIGKMDLDYDISDKSKWIVIRNSDYKQPFISKFIKNILNISDRKQIVNKSREEIQEMFQFVPDMRFYDPTLQREISNEFINYQRNKLNIPELVI